MIELFAETKTSKISYGFYEPASSDTVYFVPDVAGFIDGEYVSIPSRVEILPSGSIAFYGREYNVRQKIASAIEARISELGGESTIGEYWRGTESPNEPELIVRGTIRPSKNHMTGKYEQGLSVWPNANYLGHHKYLYKVSGVVNGWGADGEPTLDINTLKVISPIKPWDKWAPDIYKMHDNGKRRFKQLYNWTDAQMEQFKGDYKKAYLKKDDFK